MIYIFIVIKFNNEKLGSWSLDGQSCFLCPVRWTEVYVTLSCYTLGLDHKPAGTGCGYKGIEDVEGEGHLWEASSCMPLNFVFVRFVACFGMKWSHLLSPLWVSISSYCLHDPSPIEITLMGHSNWKNEVEKLNQCIEHRVERDGLC